MPNWNHYEFGYGILSAVIYLEIPMMPTIVARISFQDFLWKDEIEDGLFQIPEDFKVTFL